MSSVEPLTPYGLVATPTVLPELENPENVYALPVDPLQGDRATKIEICSVQRPHMRALHFSWFTFFCAFVGWFAIPPLLPTIKRELQLSKADVANSNIVAVTSTIIARLGVGPICDRYGPRRVQSVLLILGSIPVMSAALVTSAGGLLCVRFFIGFIGCAFVCTQAWTSKMFAKNIVGTANAIVGGWGNLGAGATFLILPVLFTAISVLFQASDDTAWRITLVIPGIALILVGISCYFFSDDSPHGSILQTQEQPSTVEKESSQPRGAKALLKALSNPNSLILGIQYACCFGVELQVNNILGLYFYEQFNKEGCIATYDGECRILSQSTAGLMASLFGIMNLFARALGGITSDKVNAIYGVKGRIGIQFILLLLEALLLVIFSQTKSLVYAGISLLLFSLFVQAAEGSTFSIVPYVIPNITGSVAGVVGAGGNFGAMCWGFLFKGISETPDALFYLSIIVAISALLSPFLRIKH